MGILVKNNVVYGSTPPVDNTISDTSENPVQNKTIYGALSTKADKSELPTIDDELSTESENPVQNKVITNTLGDVDAVLEAVLSHGFVPTEEQLEAMNSGITAEGVAQINTNKTNISSVTDHIKFDSSSKTYYLQQTQPQNPEDGDIWIG